MPTAESIVSEALKKIGVEINGRRSYDMRVHDRRIFDRILANPSLGFGDSYIEGKWDCENLDEFLTRLFQSGHSVDRPSLGLVIQKIKSTLLNLQSRNRASQVCDAHYDLGNELFEKMLDPRMVYTCAYWLNSKTLEVAQEAKMDLICRKLGIRPGMRILDIGCGWGSFMKFAAERYGASCVGYTLSSQQLELGTKMCAGYDVEFRLKDYRDIEGQYDRVVSIGMLEAVGWKNYSTYMQVVAKSLRADGLALIHTMGRNYSTRHTNPWVDKYIFPNGIVPSLQQLGESFEKILMLEDLHNFGPDYDLTLMEWNRRFQASWPELAGTSPLYTPQFKRMWEFYLLSFAANFRARNLHLWQLVLSKPGQKQTQCRQS